MKNLPKFRKGSKVTIVKNNHSAEVERVKFVDSYGFMYKLKGIIGAVSEKEIM
jgi:hypothetical protein